MQGLFNEVPDPSTQADADAGKLRISRAEMMLLRGKLKTLS